jgi:hypothetical protein
MQACDFSSFLPDIMEHIMNAYGDMKLATLYGYNNILQDASPEDQKKQREDAIQQFSEAYFSPPDRPKQSASDNECGEA